MAQNNRANRAGVHSGQSYHWSYGASFIGRRKHALPRVCRIVGKLGCKDAVDGFIRVQTGRDTRLDAWDWSIRGISLSRTKMVMMLFELSTARQVRQRHSTVREIYWTTYFGNLRNIDPSF